MRAARLRFLRIGCSNHVFTRFCHEILWKCWLGTTLLWRTIAARYDGGVRDEPLRARRAAVSDEGGAGRRTPGRGARYFAAAARAAWRHRAQTEAVQGGAAGAVVA